MFVTMKCPQCGADIEMDESKEFMFCTYCGTKVANIAQKVEINQKVDVSGTVIHKTDHSGEPNVYINYASTNPGVTMISNVPDSHQRHNYINGQTMTLRLSKGAHRIILKIGNKNYARDIYINDNNDPVRINAGWSGRAFINIDQPEYTVDSVATTIAAKPAGDGKRMSVWAIVAFILSFTVYLSPVGVGLAIFDLVKKMIPTDTSWQYLQ